MSSNDEFRGCLGTWGDCLWRNSTVEIQTERDSFMLNMHVVDLGCWNTQAAQETLASFSCVGSKVKRQIILEYHRCFTSKEAINASVTSISTIYCRIFKSSRAFCVCFPETPWQASLRSSTYMLLWPLANGHVQRHLAWQEFHSRWE